MKNICRDAIICIERSREVDIIKAEEAITKVKLYYLKRTEEKEVVSAIFDAVLFHVRREKQLLLALETLQQHSLDYSMMQIIEADQIDKSRIKAVLEHEVENIDDMDSKILLSQIISLII